MPKENIQIQRYEQNAFGSTSLNEDNILLEISNYLSPLQVMASCLGVGGRGSSRPLKAGVPSQGQTQQWAQQQHKSPHSLYGTKLKRH